MVIFAVINGLSISISSMAELLFDKKSYINLSDEEKELIEIIEEVETHLIKRGKNPNRINMDDIISFIDDRIENGPSNMRVKYRRFKKYLVEGLKRKANRKSK